jgi:signal transduction histidine kinase
MQFARPSQPRQQPIGLASLVREAVAALQAAADSRKIIVHHAEAPSELIVRGDAVQWRTALVNVLRNAVEAAPNEGWVRIGCARDGADWVEIGVEDNGPGPAPALREHLFDPFFSGRSAGRGRGLGLSAAWRLAQQNGGDVRFDGADRDATRFVLRLPVEPEPIVRINGTDNGNGHLADFAQPAEPRPAAHCTTPAA